MGGEVEISMGIRTSRAGGRGVGGRRAGGIGRRWTACTGCWGCEMYIIILVLVISLLKLARHQKIKPFHKSTHLFLYQMGPLVVYNC